jgi:hypothetical protein
MNVLNAYRPVAPAATRSASTATWSMPTRTEWTLGSTGGRSDPVNLYLHGSLSQVESALRAGGWTQAKPLTLENKVEFGFATGFDEAVKGFDALTGLSAPVPKLVRQAVASEPVSTLTYRGRPQVVAFEKDNDPLGGRHHLRVFATGKVDASGRPVWAVAATQDSGVVFAPSRPDQFFLNHVVTPNADIERDLVASSLAKAGQVSSQSSARLPYGPPAGNGITSRDSRVLDVVLR